MITLTVNDKNVSVAEGTTVAAAILLSETVTFKRSVNGTRRGPICGMGVCFECSVTIDGVTFQRSCNLLSVDGMKIATDD